MVRNLKQDWQRKLLLYLLGNQFLCILSRVKSIFFSVAKKWCVANSYAVGFEISFYVLLSCCPPEYSLVKVIIDFLSSNSVNEMHSPTLKQARRGLKI